MNKLYEETMTIKYKTYELLNMMVDVSRANIKRFAKYREEIPVSAMTSFSLGRQSGGTTAAIEYLRRNENSLLFVHTNSTRDSLIRGMGLSRSLSARVLVAAHSHPGSCFRIGHDSVLLGCQCINDLVLIFDEVDTDRIGNTMSILRQRYASSFRAVSSIVKIGTM